MTDSHVCDYCSKRCSKKYNQDCEKLKGNILPLSHDDIEVIMSQIKILVVNLPPENVADIIFGVFYTQVSWKTAQNVMEKLHKKMETVEDWRIK